MNGSYVFFALLSSIISFTFAQVLPELTNVKIALFKNSKWAVNVNYLDANSADFWRTYVIQTKCETLLQFQEVYCLGKSVNVTITDLDDPENIKKLIIKSQEPISCSLNLQDPDEAALNPRYSKGEIVLQKGNYSISMKLDKFTDVKGYRGYAVKASVPINRLIVASKCRARHNPNM